VTSEVIRPDGAVIQEISPEELKERMDRGDSLVLVDVREPFEGLLADLPEYGQERIPVKQIPFRGPELNPDATLVLYCRSGMRSAWATERLVKMGFREVFNLQGGLLAWKKRIDQSMASY